MVIDTILVQIDAEIARLQQARSLLAATGKVTTAVIERTTRKAVKAPAKAPAKGKKTRVLSPDAR
jgi:acyl-CoA thioesterase FadM